MLKIKNMKFEEIVPIGNFKEVLERFRTGVDETISRCNEEKKFNKSLATWIKTIVGDFGMIDVLEDGILKNNCWNIEEAKICLLYTHLLIIDLNQTAHTYLNNITKWDSRKDQLQEMIDYRKDIFNGLKLS
jgi:hypothetical protein